MYIIFECFCPQIWNQLVKLDLLVVRLNFTAIKRALLSFPWNISITFCKLFLEMCLSVLLLFRIPNTSSFYIFLMKQFPRSWPSDVCYSGRCWKNHPNHSTKVYKVYLVLEPEQECKTYYLLFFTIIIKLFFRLTNRNAYDHYETNVCSLIACEWGRGLRLTFKSKFSHNSILYLKFLSFYA